MIVAAPLIIACIIAGTAVWVLFDARQWAKQGTPVVFQLGPFTIEKAETWATACLLLFVIFTPIYVTARRA